jgi:hypothetical protein
MIGSPTFRQAGLKIDPHRRRRSHVPNNVSIANQSAMDFLSSIRTDPNYDLICRIHPNGRFAAASICSNLRRGGRSKNDKYRGRGREQNASHRLLPAKPLYFAASYCGNVKTLAYLSGICSRLLDTIDINLSATVDNTSP